jgi:hypothetical protein
MGQSRQQALHTSSVLNREYECRFKLGRLVEDFHGYAQTINHFTSEFTATLLLGFPAPSAQYGTYQKKITPQNFFQLSF